MGSWRSITYHLTFEVDKDVDTADVLTLLSNGDENPDASGRWETGPPAMIKSSHKMPITMKGYGLDFSPWGVSRTFVYQTNVTKVKISFTFSINEVAYNTGAIKVNGGDGNPEFLEITGGSPNQEDEAVIKATIRQIGPSTQNSAI
jgi:hypothetical protein